MAERKEFADAGAVTQGSDMNIFSDGATVNAADGSVTMYYSHDRNATHNARVELYLVGKEENLLVAQSGLIPPGNELTVMPLKAKESQLPSDASYEGAYAYRLSGRRRPRRRYQRGAAHHRDDCTLINGTVIHPFAMSKRTLHRRKHMKNIMKKERTT